MIHDVIRELDFNKDGDEEEEDDEGQSLVQRKRRKRALESPKEVEAEVPAKRSRRIVQKYATPSKEGSSAKVAPSTTTRRKRL